MLFGLAGIGKIHEAWSLLNAMPEKNIISWNLMIVGLVRNGDLETTRLQEARKLFEKLSGKDGGVVHWTTLLMRYTKSRCVNDAQMLFEIMPERNIKVCLKLANSFEEMPERNAVSWSSMLFGLVGVKKIHEAWSLLNAMPEKNIISWNLMIAGLVRNEHICVVTTHYSKVTCDDLWLLPFLSQHRLQEAHKLLEKLSEKNGGVVHWTSLLMRYTKSGCVNEARMLFEIMPQRNIVTYNAMLSGVGKIHEAWSLLNVMPEKNIVSWNLMIAGLVKNERDGSIVHWTSLLMRYTKSGCLNEARMLFEIMLETNTVTYNAMLSGVCAIWEVFLKVANSFEEMPKRNAMSWSSMLFGLAGVGKIHEAWSLLNVMSKKNIVSWNLMIARLQEAHKLLEKLFERDGGVVRWTSLLTRYTKSGCVDEARILFDIMPERNIVTYSAMLSGVCAIWEVCMKLANSFEKMSERNAVSWNSMLFRLVGVGTIHATWSLLNAMLENNIVSWNLMIAGLVRNGDLETIRRVLVQ
ncbi:pentatricopeptide repeat-containing protein At4g02750 [Ziziphus jujuba]|uniref:Pentatricopeptide repeat-containing protein At4g02750 n=1 Tax=Ziziphus jujuba TaxID=326968 RepID=A0ABM3ZXC4_ZIZJJ|nr:pentatricopeptide repeat-containing protein At4g02750 [Ziziphus jujuba]